MGQILALSKRPKKLSQLIGQKKISDSIKAMVASGRIPNCFMFSGQTGTGKTTLARILAVSFQCTHAEFGEPCDECYAKKDNFQIRELNASSPEVSGVNELNGIIQNANHSPLAPTRKRVYILDEAQRLSTASQNLLLKTCEDTPRSTVWIIVTTDAQKILNTLRRRFTQFSVKSLSYSGVERLVRRVREESGIKVNVQEFTEAVMEAGIFSPALILMALDKKASGLSIKESILGIDENLDTLKICRAVVKGELAELHAELKKTGADDSRAVRYAVGGYLNSMLLNNNGLSEIETMGILQLAEIGRMDENLQMSATNAVLHRLCLRFKGK